MDMRRSYKDAAPTTAEAASITTEWAEDLLRRIEILYNLGMIEHDDCCEFTTRSRDLFIDISEAIKSHR